jgi:hypothetical protein
MENLDQSSATVIAAAAAMILAKDPNAFSHMHQSQKQQSIENEERMSTETSRQGTTPNQTPNNDSLINNYSKLIDLSKVLTARTTHEASHNKNLAAPARINDVLINAIKQQHQLHEAPTAVHTSANTPIFSINKKKPAQDFHNPASNNENINTNGPNVASSNNGAVSSEVKLKLKNAILQKLHDKNQLHNHTNNGSNLITPTVNTSSNGLSHNNPNLNSISMFHLPSHLTNHFINNNQLADLSNSNNKSNLTGGGSFIVNAMNQTSDRLCSPSQPLLNQALIQQHQHQLHLATHQTGIQNGGKQLNGLTPAVHASKPEHGKIFGCWFLSHLLFDLVSKFYC